ncbi:hypothetical protein JCM8547_008014 [Rhodosporidiobolus lusitaniae]
MSGVPGSLDYPVHSYQGSPSSIAGASPAPSTSAPCNKRKASDLSSKDKGKGKAKSKDEGEDEQDGSDGEGGDSKKRKRNRMALSCKECKRRKIKCDRVMPVCGNCTKRNRPGDCSWDVFQPANDAFLPATLARTADVDQLAARLAHVEKYLQTLPPNFAQFRPAVGPPPTAEGVEGNVRAILAGTAVKEGDREEGYSDTEDAAVNLENGVFNGRLELPGASLTTSSAPLPQSLAPSSAQQASVPVRPALQQPPQPSQQHLSRFGAPQVELTPALTSIVSSVPVSSFNPSSALASTLGIDFDATPEEMRKARRDEVERILRALPSREVTEFLVERYFASVAWLFNHLHAPSFRSELAFFYDTLCSSSPSRAHEVDLSFLSLLLMILCLALDSTHYRRSPLALSNKDGTSTEEGKEGEKEKDPLSGYTDEQRRALPQKWFAASMRALRLAEWETIPKVRTIQTIVLFTQYLQLSSASRGQPAQLALWLAAAIRLAQVLELHRLGSNPETMPPEDPAWPPGRNSLKREMAKRLWAVLVYQDWLGANSHTRAYMISPLHFDTDDPSNVNDDDLSPSTTSIQPAPSSVLTDSSASRVRIAMARQVRIVFDRVVLGAQDWSKSNSADTVLELDAGFRAILDELPERWTLAADQSEQEQPMRRFQRHFVLEGLHNRIFRLHRPLLGRAGKNPKYKFSADACLKSARAVVVSTHNIRKAVADVPYTYSHVLGAALVLFNDLFQAIDHDLSAPEIDSKLSTLHLALEIFSSVPTSPALLNVVQQGHRILSGLFREEERRRTARAARALLLASTGGVIGEGGAGEEDEQETFAEVLQRIARSLNADSAPHRGTPPPTRNIPSKSSGGAAQNDAAARTAGALPAHSADAAAGNPSFPSDALALNPTASSSLSGFASTSNALSSFANPDQSAFSPSLPTSTGVSPFPNPPSTAFDLLGYSLPPGTSTGFLSFGGTSGGTTNGGGLFDPTSNVGYGLAYGAGGAGSGGSFIGAGDSSLSLGFLEDYSANDLDLGLGAYGVQYWGGGGMDGVVATGAAGGTAGGYGQVPPTPAVAQPPATGDIASMSAAEFWGTANGV